jgi:hypothetical protein
MRLLCGDLRADVIISNPAVPGAEHSQDMKVPSASLGSTPLIPGLR